MTGFEEQVWMGHTPTGPTGAVPGPGRSGPRSEPRSVPGRTANGLGLGGAWGGLAGMLGAVALSIEIGILSLVEAQDPATAAGLALILAVAGTVVGGLIGGFVGGLAGMVLGALKWERAAPVVAAAASMLVYGGFFGSDIGRDGAARGTMFVLLGALVFGAIGYLVGRGFERSTRSGIERELGNTAAISYDYGSEHDLRP